MQTFLRFYKDTAKLSSLPLLKITTKSTATTTRYQYCGLNFKQIKCKRSQNLTSEHQAVKKCANCKDFFQKLWIKKQYNFSKNKLFSSSQ